MLQTTHRVLCADARRLDALGDESVDLVVTSPPYPMIAMWDELFGQLDPAIAERLACGDGRGAHELMHRALAPAWRELFRVLRAGGIACINIGDATRTIDGAFCLYPNHARIISELHGIGFEMLPLILWRKPTNSPTKFMGSGMLPPGAYVTLEHEYIIIVRKGGARRFTDDAGRTRRRASAFFWEERNTWFSDVWEIRGSRQELGGNRPRDRSGAFPFELAFRLVAMFSVGGDLVLDPFAGTGTTTWAAAAAGRNSMSVEIEHRLAKRLLSAAAEPLEALRLQDDLNRYLRDRLTHHAEFAREGRAADGHRFVLGYQNPHHGFAVMTAQEVDLRIDLIDSIIRQNEDTVVVTYVGRGELGQ